MRIGIDVGGTKIEGILLDGSQELDRHRVSTPQGDYEGTVRSVVGLVAHLDPDGSASVGMGTPGSVSPTTGLMRNANSVVLNGKPFVDDVAAALDRPVRAANDADCMALSEASDGAGAEAASVFGVILGTGVGGGLVVDGALVAGHNRIAGEWGHNSLPFPTADEMGRRPCWCGLTGCIERWMCGEGLAETYADVTSKSVPDGAAVAARAAEGDTGAQIALSRYVDQLGRALAGVVNIFDPEVIVLGGGLSNIDVLYDAVPDVLDRHVFSDHVETSVVRAQHGDSTGVRGAAWLWPAGS
ncbi:MAG: ROK family protein [Acidimicrobiia bacterium]|nr:ROK family protein [Acidimicrobiia bacterium]